MNKVFTFDNIEIGKFRFHQFKHPIDINNVNNGETFGNKRFKYFTVYKVDEKVSRYVQCLQK